jgi:hypothetical protein
VLLVRLSLLYFIILHAYVYIAALLYRYSINLVLHFTITTIRENDAAVATIANKIGFTASYRRLRCSPHTLNLIGQTLLWGKDAEAFDNAGENV